MSRLAGTYALAIALLCSNCAVAPSTSTRGGSAQERQRRIQTKFEEVQRLAPEWVAAGGDAGELQQMMQRARASLQSGDLVQSERHVDEVLGLLGATAPGVPAALDQRAGSPRRGEPLPVKLARIPEDASIVFRRDHEIFAMNFRGGNVAQITFDNPQDYEHVSASFDHTKLASNRWGAEPGHSTLWVSDLVHGIEVQLVPEFASAGAGGVDWDPRGFIYFAGRKEGAGERQDVYKIRHDGTGLERLTSTRAGATDVGLSEDGGLVAYLEVVPRRVAGRQVVTYRPWVMDTDGRNKHLVYEVEEIDPKRVGNFIGTADPTPSPNANHLVFSMENPRHKNYANNPGLNTAHDLYIVDMDGTSLRRLTEEGPISIIPDWQADAIVYTEINEEDDYQGISVIHSDGSGKRRLGSGNAAKWIRPRSSNSQPESR